MVDGLLMNRIVSTEDDFYFPLAEKKTDKLMQNFNQFTSKIHSFYTILR